MLSMKFSEYLAPFEGDLRNECLRRLGSNLSDFSGMKEDVLRSFDLYRRGRLRTVQEFYRLAVSKGIIDLTVRANPIAPWLAENICEEIEGRCVIDVGCCDGTFTVFYAINHPRTNFVGIDLSEDALVAAKRRAEDHSVTNTSWVCADAMTLDAPFTRADTVIAQHSLYQMLPWDGHESLFLERLAPFVRQDSKIVIAGNRRRLNERKYNGYELCNYRTEKTFDPNIERELSYEIVVFRRV